MQLEASRGKIVKIIKRLRKAYPESRVPLKYKSPFRVLVTTILSAQCTDKRAGQVASYIFKKYKDVKGIAGAKRLTLQKEIRSSGLYENKAKSLISASKRIVKEHNSRVPDTMEELTALSGVGRKTANIVLSAAYKKAVGIAVDTHVKRLSRRLGLSRQDVPDKIEGDLLKIVPPREWLDFNYIFVTHGRKICRAQKASCCDCIINDLCPSNRCKL